MYVNQTCVVAMYTAEKHFHTYLKNRNMASCIACGASNNIHALTVLGIAAVAKVQSKHVNCGLCLLSMCDTHEVLHPGLSR